MSYDAAFPRVAGGTARLVALTGIQGSGILWLSYQTALETPEFRALLTLAMVGAAVSAAIPRAHRLAFFAALSMASVVIVAGMAGVLVIGVCAAMLGICHLPIAVRARVSLMVLVGLALVLLRTGHGSVDLPATAWPILASMLMFRLGLYFAAVRQGDVKTGLAPAFAYTFMLPNACFALFPVVDYRTFMRSMDDTRTDTVDRGFHWIVRGMIQLLVYRVVYYDVAPREMLVYGLGDLVRFLLATVLLYLRVSGTFHVITGILHLFGFQVPPTHRLYFLATSFPDYWRRINTYWRDYMMRIVYYPVALQLRTYSTATRAVAATLAVFLVSWMFHSYQYFWINGTPLLTIQDVSFWLVFAVLVTGATIRGRRGRGSPDAGGWNVRRGSKTLQTFVAVTLLWSWWSASSPEVWVFLWTQARWSEPADWILLVAVVTVIFVLGASPWGKGPADVDDQKVSTARTVRRLTTVLALCVVMLPDVQKHMPGPLRQYAAHLRGYGVIDQQALIRLRGYYEDVMRGRPGSNLVPPPDVKGDTRDLFISRDDFLITQLRPSVRGQYRGKAFTTNAAGVRDREYDVAKPAGTLRIALLGPSDVMGAGVADSEVFESIVEGRLDSLARRAGRRLEIINFGLQAWALAQRVQALKTLAARYAPDVVLVAVNPYEIFLDYISLGEARRRGIVVPDAELDSLVGAAGITGDMPAIQMMNRLRTVEGSVAERSLAWLLDEARAVTADVAVVTLSLPGVSWTGGLSLMKRTATAQGIPVLECAGVWRWKNRDELALSEMDPHPNVAGHRLIADCLFERLLASRAAIPALRHLPTPE